MFTLNSLIFVLCGKQREPAEDRQTLVCYETYYIRNNFSVETIIFQ